MKKITSLILIVTIMLSNSVMLSRATESKPVAEPYSTIIQAKIPSPKPKKKVANHSNFKKFYLGLTAFSLAAIALLSKNLFFNKEKNTEKLTVAPENNFPKSESVNKSSDLTPPEKKTDEEVIVEKLQPLVKESTSLAGQTNLPSINSDHFVSSIFQRPFDTFDPNVCTSIFEERPGNISHQCIVPSNSSIYFNTAIPTSEPNIENDPEDNDINTQEDFYVDDEAEYNQTLPLKTNKSIFWNILSKKISYWEATLIATGIYGACKLTKFIVDKICPRAKKLTEVAYQTALEKTLQTQSTQTFEPEKPVTTVTDKFIEFKTPFQPKKFTPQMSSPQTFSVDEVTKTLTTVSQEAVDIAGKAAKELTLVSPKAIDILSKPVEKVISESQTFSVKEAAKTLTTVSQEAVDIAGKAANKIVDKACQIGEEVIKTVTPTPTTPQKVVENPVSPTILRGSPSFNSPVKMLLKNSKDDFAALAENVKEWSPGRLEKLREEKEKNLQTQLFNNLAQQSPTRTRSSSNPGSPSKKTSWLSSIFG